MSGQRPDGALGSARGSTTRTDFDQTRPILNSHHNRTLSLNNADAVASDLRAKGIGHHDNDSLNQQQRPKRIACKECRQAKLRCDGLNNGIGPCIRCRQRSLGCQLDTGFKRVNKRKKISELEEQLEHLRSVVGERNVGNTPKVTLQTFDAGSQYRSPESQPSPASVTSHQQRINDGFHTQRERVNDNSDVLLPQTWQTVGPRAEPPINGHRASSATSSARCLENIELNGSQIDDLFSTFFSHYHQFLEILDPSVTPDTYYESSPVLFWTIISVAARRYDYDIALLGSLNPCVTKLIWSSASQPPLPSFTIQALLLLSMWPFPVDTLWKDPSFLLVSIAKSAAMQNGLHQPETMQDFLRVKTQLEPEEFQAAVKLWAGCYIAAECATTCAGQPSLFSCDWVIDRACATGNNYTLPDSLRYHLRIHRFLMRVNNARRTLSPTGQPTEKGGSLMRLLECDFEDLERDIGNKIGNIFRIALTMVSLQLRIYYFFESPASEKRKEGLLRAYDTALGLASMVANEDRKTDVILYMPHIFCLMLNTSAMLILKIMNSSYSRYVDVEGGKRTFNLILNLLRKSTLEDNDTRGRAGKIMAQLSIVQHSPVVRRDQEPSLRVKSRLGANVLHDGLWNWRDEFGSQGGLPSGPSQPVSNPTRSAPSNSPATSFAQQQQHMASDPKSGTGNNDGQVSAQIDQTYMPDQILDNMNNLAGDISNLDWVLDARFPSLLPIDIDSYSLPLEFQNGENNMR